MGKAPRRYRPRKVVARSSYPRSADTAPTTTPSNIAQEVGLRHFDSHRPESARGAATIFVDVRALQAELRALAELVAVRDEARRVVVAQDDHIRTNAVHLRVDGAQLGSDRRRARHQSAGRAPAVRSRRASRPQGPTDARAIHGSRRRRRGARRSTHTSRRRTGGFTMDKLETLSPEEVATAIGASPWWVREQARRRRIPHLRLGRGRIRFLPEHVDALIRRATVRERERQPESVDLTALGATARFVRAHLVPRRSRRSL